MSTENTNTPEQNNEKITELIKDIRIAMLTTMDEDGQLHSRPMGTLQNDFDGSIWFFCSNNSPKIHSIENDTHVNLAYSQPSDQKYISMAGKASVVDDKAKMKELWQPYLKAWFPEGLEDPKLTLLKVDVESAQYWEAPASTVVKIVGFTKALLTGKTYKGGESKKIQVQH